MRFIVDEPLPPALARWLRQREFAAEHVAELGLLSTDDLLICEHGAKTGAVIITKDEDYETLLDKTIGLRVVWVHIGNAINRVLLGRLEQVWPYVIVELEAGATLVHVYEDRPVLGDRISEIERPARR